MCISIHAAREGGDINHTHSGYAAAISIHAAREGGDGCIQRHAANKCISIHAAREGGDGKTNDIDQRDIYFNPRRP